MVNFWEKLNKPITLLAPMDDVTDVAFREVLAKIAKPDVMFTEFTSVYALASKGREKALRKLRYTEIQRPVVAQIWGSTPDHFRKVAADIQNLGFDGLDINMGCPQKTIIKKGAGAALIGNNELAGQIIAECKNSTPIIPISVKTRLATDDIKTYEWISFLLAQNISALTLHARTAAKMSKGEADWNEIGKAVKIRNKLGVNTLIIGNGDVTSYKEVIEKQTVYGVDGVMIGRGVFYNPWVFERNSNPVEHSQKEYIDLLVTHLELFNDYWGSSKNYESLKKFFKIYIRETKGSSILRQSLMKTRNYEQALDVLKNYERPYS